MPFKKLGIHLDPKNVDIEKHKTEPTIPYFDYIHPCLLDIKRFNHIINNTDNLSLTFKQPPLTTYRRGPTLGIFLSKTSLTQNIESEPGFYHCNRPTAQPVNIQLPSLILFRHSIINYTKS